MADRGFGCHCHFTAAIVASLVAREEVTGVVATGSMAASPTARTRGRTTAPGSSPVPAGPEPMRRSRDRLPRPDEIVLTVRELYHLGHLVEFAAFEPGELAVARVNEYAILVDRYGQTAVAVAVVAAPARWRSGQADRGGGAEVVRTHLAAVS